MRHGLSRISSAAALAAALFFARAAAAQTHAHDPTGLPEAPRAWRLGFMGVGELTTASPMFVGRRYTEGYLTQPNLMGDAAWRRLRFVGTLNGEGYTLQRGELNPGMYGEGYIDRRHPHTLVHEAMLSYETPRLDVLRDLAFSIAVGKGFTSYGTDDPMMRPFVKYPVNHHHAQIIERVQAIAALSIGDPVAGRGAALEYGAYNGDEPRGAFIGPAWSRFGDSWGTRLTVKPLARLELQGSRAFVRSPGFTRGGAFDHHQTSLSARYDRSAGAAMAHAGHGGGAAHAGDAAHAATPSSPNGLVYALAEVARTDEGIAGARAFRYESVLAEALYAYRGASLSLRAESTERPESERLLDVFRTSTGHVDFQIVGITRWRTITANVSPPPVTFARRAGITLVPFVELARAEAAARRTPTVFDPREFYGGNVLWSASAGVRVHAGPMRARMGRYGVLASRGVE